MQTKIRGVGALYDPPDVESPILCRVRDVDLQFLVRRDTGEFPVLDFYFNLLGTNMLSVFFAARCEAERSI